MVGEKGLYPIDDLAAIAFEGVGGVVVPETKEHPDELIREAVDQEFVPGKSTTRLGHRKRKPNAQS